MLKSIYAGTTTRTGDGTPVTKVDAVINGAHGRTRNNQPDGAFDAQKEHAYFWAPRSAA